MVFNFNKTHSASQALQAIHEKMIKQYKINKQDINKAKKMQEYLQYFKKIFLNPEEYQTKNKMLSSLGLEQEAIEQMRADFQKILGVTDNYKQIFRSKHFWYADRKDFDDIVEGELNALLQVMAEKAINNKNNKQINLGQKIEGGQSAYIDIDLNSLGEEVVQGLAKKLEAEVNQISQTEILDEIRASSQGRSGKSDVSGYNKQLVIEAKVKNNFKEFIDLFTGVSFSVKNYSSEHQYNIHLGDTLPFKAMYSSLSSLGIKHQSAIHVYFHAKYSFEKHNTSQDIGRNTDIFHLRYIYELTGAGLVDEKKNSLKAVDFFIYNDPTSDKIYVKSTKEMIANILDKKELRVNNPWKSIYVSKLDFN